MNVASGSVVVGDYGGGGGSFGSTAAGFFVFVRRVACNHLYFGACARDGSVHQIACLGAGEG